MTDSAASAASENNTPIKTADASAGAVDTQALINAALAKQKAELDAHHASEFEKATGHKNPKAFADAKLSEDGKLKELADTRLKETEFYKTKFQQSAIHNAVVAAASEAVDVSVVSQLLVGRCQCDDDGQVTIDGKPVAEAVAALLKDKPFLAKAQGSAGSGAGSQASGGKQVSRVEFDRLTPDAKMNFIRNGGTVI